MSKEHDEFFDDVYVRSTEPFLSEAMSEAEVTAFASLVPMSPSTRILDLGCGWGRHGAVLRARGLKAHGIERARGSSKRAAGAGLRVVRGDVRALPYRSSSFEFVACFYSSIFFFDEAENQRCLDEVARVLVSGGTFVLQAANPMHLLRLGEEETTLSLPDGGVVWEQSRFDAESGREIGVRRIRSPGGETREARYSIRHYGPGELEVMARRAGLRLTDLRGSLALEPWARTSRELIAVMTRR